ncbi:MAG: hypothetical protein ABI776_00060 [Nocardioidaceae bacterium]
MSRPVAALVTLCALVLGGCVLRGGVPEHIADLAPATRGAPAPAAASPAASSPGSSPGSSAGGEAGATQGADPSGVSRLTGDPYADLARRLHARGVGIWFEIDLVARWREGPQAFAEGLDRLRKLSSVPGVRGFKVADELGYDDGITSAAEATDFLRAVRSGLRSVPHARVLIDVVVPELGCLGWTGYGSRSCTDEARAKHPAASVAAVTGYLREGLVDRLDLSTSLLDEWTYQGWGTSQGQAQAAAWRHVRDLGWARLTALQSRKALADAGGYQGSPQQAARDVRTFVELPSAGGAQAVDVWTWRQEYDGRTVSLLDGTLTSNPLWARLVASHRAGVRLFTHITPSLLLPTGAERAREYARVAQAFDAVFVAAGTG